MPVTLGYWSLRGIVEPIRYLLRHVGEDFEEKRFPLSMEENNWFSVKFTLGLEFPNLPYMMDGNTKLTQSLAILRYLARKHGLAGKDDKETALLDMLEQQSFDLLRNLNQLAYRPDFETQVQDYVKALPDKLKLFSQYLADKQFLLGERISYVDFYLYEAIDHNRMLVASCLKDFENLQSYMDRIEALPNIRKYMDSEDFIRWPIYAPFANFGGKGEYPMFK